MTRLVLASVGLWVLLAFLPYRSGFGFEARLLRRHVPFEFVMAELFLVIVLAGLCLVALRLVGRGERASGFAAGVLLTAGSLSAADALRAFLPEVGARRLAFPYPELSIVRPFLGFLAHVLSAALLIVASALATRDRPGTEQPADRREPSRA